jgi:hypothetical protein
MNNNHELAILSNAKETCQFLELLLQNESENIREEYLVFFQLKMRELLEISGFVSDSSKEKTLIDIELGNNPPTLDQQDQQALQMAKTG